MLGVKEYPYGVSSRFEKHSGGGIAKVVIDLVNELIKIEEISSVSLIVRRMPGQKKYEELGKLKVIYDDNRISIEGDTHIAFTEDVSARYRAYGWNVIDVPTAADGRVDLIKLDAAMVAAKSETVKPTLIRMQSIIAYQTAQQANSSLQQST